MFRFLRKLDLAFSQLLRQYDGAAEKSDHNRSHYHLTPTEKVRMKSLVQETRVVAVDVAAASGYSADLDDASDPRDDEDVSECEDDMPVSATNDEVSTAISRIYRQTLDYLGDSLG